MRGIRVASQHTDCKSLACLNKRDSCIAFQPYMVFIFLPVYGESLHGFCFFINEYKMEEEKKWTHSLKRKKRWSAVWEQTR